MGFTTSLLHTNRLLDSLPEGDRERFLADCETVEMGFGEVLSEPGDSISHVHFPLDCCISLIATLEGGRRLEVSMAGSEGMVGSSLILGVHESPLLTLVQGAGPSLRMSSALFQNHLGQSPALEGVIKHYLNVLLNQISLSAACAHYHEVEARLARWLLMTHDRAHADELHLTHEFLSGMLGVRRAGVSLAAKALQSRGLIDYQHGRITINDRPGLEKASCRCYAADREIYDGQMLEQVDPAVPRAAANMAQ